VIGTSEERHRACCILRCYYVGIGQSGLASDAVPPTPTRHRKYIRQRLAYKHCECSACQRNIRVSLSHYSIELYNDRRRNNIS